MEYSPLCASAPKLLVNCPKNLVRRPLIMKIVIFSCTHGTLFHFKLSHMDFPDGPAAIHSSRTTCSGLTQSAGPNELINPEKSLKNRPIFTYSFLGSGPAVFPGSVISSHACIVFLSEASSSSHVESIIARQRGPLGPDTVIWPCLTVSNHEICHIFHHARDLDAA